MFPIKSKPCLSLRRQRPPILGLGRRSEPVPNLFVPSQITFITFRGDVLDPPVRQLFLACSYSASHATLVRIFRSAIHRLMSLPSQQYLSISEAKQRQVYVCRYACILLIVTYTTPFQTATVMGLQYMVPQATSLFVFIPRCKVVHSMLIISSERWYM